jgi:RNA polymerase sigma factor (sigma-70 family)
MPPTPDDLRPDPADPSSGSPEDRQLVVALLAGDAEALRRLIERYDRLIRYAIFKAGRRYCDRDPAWLDARANEAWSGIVQALRRLGPRHLPSNVGTYFAQVARNKALDAIRQADAEQIIPFVAKDLADHGSDPESDPEDDPAAILENLEELDALRDCLARLSEQDQVICAEIGLIMEKQWEEAAARLEMAESTLRSRWRGVLGRLRVCLEKKSKKNQNRLAPPDTSSDS